MPAFAPFRHNVDSAEHARTFRVTDAGGANISVEAGRVRIDQTVTNFAVATALGPLANGTHFIYISSAAPPVITALLGGPYPANSIPLARVVVAGGDVTGITDDRCFFYEDTAAGGGGNTLDAAYDQGGAGAGRIITVDNGPVELRHNADTALLATRDSGGADVADRFSISRDGDLGWGSGAGAQDVHLSRAAANHLLLAAGDRFRVNYIADTAGNDHVTFNAAGAARTRFALATRFDTNIGHFVNPSVIFAYVLSTTSAVIVSGLQFTMTFSGAQAWGRGINASVIHTGTNAAMDLIGGWYYAAWRSNTNSTGRLVGIHAETRADLMTVGTWAESRVIEVASPTYTAAVITTLHTGIWVEDQGNAALTNVYSLRIFDISAGTNRYLIEAGPPYFRVLGGFTAAANRTPIYISEGAGPALRQLRTMDPGAGGANFAGGELVCILV